MMDDEVEDIVGDVRCTDSQKSVTTSTAYSPDFTDSSPERHHSSGKDTYVLDRDDTDDSDSIFHTHIDTSLVDSNAVMSQEPKIQQLLHNDINKPASVALAHHFTQTSKTVVELTRNDIIVIHKPTESHSLQTQTSLVSMAEHKTTNYKVHIDNEKIYTKDVINKKILSPDIQCAQTVTNIEFPHLNTKEIMHLEENIRSNNENSELDIKTNIYSEHSSEDIIIPFIDDESKEAEDIKTNDLETTSEFESSKYYSDIEEDSLMLESEYCGSSGSKGDNASDTSEMQTSIDNDVKELYNKLSECPLLRSPLISIEPCALKIGIMTPLSEEMTLRRSFLDLTGSSQTLMEHTNDTGNDTLFVKNAGNNMKMFSDGEFSKENEKITLPPILNRPCPYNPSLNFLFSLNTNGKSFGKTCTLPCLFESNKNDFYQSWNIEANELASGECPLISGRSNPVKLSRDPVYLPPIYVEGAVYHNSNKPNLAPLPQDNSSPPSPSSDAALDAISISGRIKELKKINNNRNRLKVESRSCSPTSHASPEGARLRDVADRGCDNLCAEVLRRLRSPSWVEILETLEDIPRSLEKYWSNVTGNRTADLLRQVLVHIDSPRTAVATCACAALADILVNTNYRRKPDFDEAVSTLLSKTGSSSRPVRRAANVALDAVACAAGAARALAAVCAHGVDHKSALVRCAAARLLVVRCALAGGGRRLLRARPPSAAAARRRVLRALALLLQDRNIDTRKYAERLYRLLRPLPTFEGHFLTDVDAELAARLMKKYDALMDNRRDR